MPCPQFAHVPMILGGDKARLSKRHGATSVMAYQEMGYLPEALVNYLVRLGWSSGDQEVFTREELIRKFSLDNVGKSAAVFNAEKLLWLNGVYIRQESPERLAGLLLPFLEARGLKPRSMDWLAEVTATLRERARTLVEMADMAEFYLRDDFAVDEKAEKKHLSANIKPSLETLVARLEGSAEIGEKDLEDTMKEIAAAENLKLGAIAQAVRVALTGKSASPGIYEVMRILGREEVLKRLARAIRKL